MLDNNCISKEVEEPDTVAHTCNPSYLGGRNWEDPGLRPAWVKSQLNRAPPPPPPTPPGGGGGGGGAALPLGPHPFFFLEIGSPNFARTGLELMIILAFTSPRTILL
jgi:hypothetical protein